MLIESECPLLPEKVRDYDYGGTDVACILGVNKYKSAYNYWLEKTGKIEKQPVQNEAVYFGVQQERTIMNEYLDRFGDGDKVNFSVKVPKTEIGNSGVFLGGECDATILDSDYWKRDIILEAKTANGFVWRNDFKQGKEVPVFYDCQGAYYCAKTGIRTVIFCILTDGRYFFMERNYSNEECLFAVDTITDYHRDYIIGDSEPSVDGGKACTEFVKKIANTMPEGTAEIDDEELDKAVKDACELKKTIKDMKLELDLAENKIRTSLDEFEDYYPEGYKVTYKQASDSYSIDGKQIEVNDSELFTELMEKYKKTRKGGRRLLIKEI